MNSAVYWQRANRKVLGVVALCSLIVMQAAYDNYQVLDQKAQQQKTALAELKRWKSEYEALLPIQTQWNETIPPVQGITDVFRLFNAMRLDSYGLSSNQEKLGIRKEISPVLSNGTPLNATRICVSSAGDSGLAVTAPHFSGLLSGLDELASRRDVEMSNITLSVSNGAPKAVVDLCLVFRN